MTTYAVAPIRTQPTGPSEEARPTEDVIRDDVVDVWGRDSFPASDPPSNW